MKIRRLVVLVGLVFALSAAERLLTGAGAEEPMAAHSRPAYQADLDRSGPPASNDLAGARRAFESTASLPLRAKAEAEPVKAAVTMSAQLRPAYQAYLDASESLASDDVAGSRQAFERLLDAVEQVDAATLEEDVRSRWTTISDAISGAARKSLDAGDAAAVRLHFRDVSGGMLSLADTFGQALETPLFKGFCPMVGASWLQAGREVRNPYYGSQMLGCGSTTPLGGEVVRARAAPAAGLLGSTDSAVKLSPSETLNASTSLADEPGPVPTHNHFSMGGPTSTPHTDHTPHHGGALNMNGNLHLETVLERTGRVSVYLTDEYRRPLAPEAISDLKIVLNPEEPEEAEIAIGPDPSGTYWQGQGSAIDETGAKVLIAYSYEGAEHSIAFEVAHLLKAAPQQAQQTQAPSRSHVPGAINLGLTGGQPSGSYAAPYLETAVRKEVTRGTYQQSGQTHFNNEPRVDIPLVPAPASESVQLGAQAPPSAPVREYNVSAIDAEITLNQYHDFYPGYMFVLTENIAKVREEERRNEAARFEDNGPTDPGAVTNGLSGDAIQPLAIRVNQGERLVINLTNSLGDDHDEKISLHLHGSGLVIQETGEPATALNAGSYVEKGKTKTFEWYVPLSEQEGIHHFHSQFRDQASQGLFGSVTVEPAGSRFLDPYTGAELKSGWLAMIEDPNGPDFREFVVVYHEVGNEEFRPLMKTDDTIPLREPLTDTYRPSTRAINYRSESFGNNLVLQQKLFGMEDESMGYSSYTFGDPTTPIPRSYLGDPAKWRLLHGGSEVFHSHHLHGGAIRWRRQDELAEDQNIFGNDFFSMAKDGPVKLPPVRSASDRVDVQTIGPAEGHDLTIECGSGGCQQTAGDFLYHCHIPQHYVAGMWAFWRVYNTLQVDGGTDVMPDLRELPDRVGRMKPAVNSTQIEGRTMNWFGKQFRITRAGEGGSATPGVYSIEKWVEQQLPPQGKPGKKADEKEQILSYDASVWDWAKQTTADGKTLYLGEPETSIDWPKYKPEKRGERPELLFDYDTGKLAWPHMKPHFGKRPPFSAGRSGAPFLEPIHEGTNVARPGENGPWSLSPEGTADIKRYNVHAIKTPITRAGAEGTLPPIVDANGQIFVLHEEEEAIRANDALKVPLVIRANVGDTVDVTFSSELPDEEENLSSSKVNMHIHFVQFDTQASDGVITGMSYEQSVRPFTMLDDDDDGFGKPQNEPLAAAAAAGASRITLRGTDPFQPGVLIGIGMDQVGKLDIRKVRAIEGNDLVLDEPLTNAHGAGEIASTEFVRYRWYADSDFGITFWHDHAFGLTSWGHGLFGSLVVEPRGSTYHNPVTGQPVRSGPIADIHTTEPVSSTVTGSFREFVLQIQDSVPLLENRILAGTVFESRPPGQTAPSKISKLGSLDSWSLPDTAFKYLNGGERTTGSSFSLRVEPLNRRLRVNPDPSKLFSSAVHGDPYTPTLRAYLGDPIVLRALDHAGNEMHTVHVNGHYFPMERFAANARPRSSVHLGIAERYDLVIPAAGGPQKMAGDYLYHSGRTSHLAEGMWGLLRVSDQRAANLQPLPGREQIPQSAQTLYPADAPVKTFNVSAIDLPIDLNPRAPAVIPTSSTNRNIVAENADGKIFVLNEELDAVVSGRKAPHPLVLRANVGDAIKVNLTNRLKAERVSFHADMLAYDPKDSLGINVGNNQGDQTIAPGQSRTYTFYAHPEYGEAAALVTDWGNVTSNTRNGLYGAIIIGPRGSTYHDPATGNDISLGNAWRADVVVNTAIAGNEGRSNYRDVALLFQDEDNLIGTAFMTYAKSTAGLSAVNYRIEPLEWRANEYGLDFAEAYVSNGQNEPATPIIEARVGDAVRIHVFGAHSEQNTTFSIDNHQWPLEPAMQGAELLEADHFGGTDALEVNIVAGGPRRIPGDYIYQNHRLAYAEAGQWGILRVLPARVGQATPGTPGNERIVALDSYKTRATVVNVASVRQGETKTGGTE